MKKYLTLLVIMSATALAGCGTTTPQKKTTVMTPTQTTQTEKTTGSTTATTGTTSTKGIGGLPTPQKPARESISIQNMAYAPASMTIKVGTIVTWTNNDKVSHTVTANDGSFGGILSKGKTFSHTFTKAGTYSYHCNFHPSMKATIIVE